MVVKNGVRFVLEESRYKFLLGFKLLSIKVFVGFLDIRILLFILIFCKIEVNGLLGILIEKNLSFFL